MTRRLLALLCLLFVFSTPAQALCLPAVCTCTLATTNVAFGNYNPMAFSNTDTTGTIKVDCGGVVGLFIPFNVVISAGGSGNFANRAMKNGSNTLAYNLYSDSSYTKVWGDGSNATQIVSSGVTLDALGLAPAQNFYVYGRIAARQTTAIPGYYFDSLSVTLTYF